MHRPENSAQPIRFAKIPQSVPNLDSLPVLNRSFTETARLAASMLGYFADEKAAAAGPLTVQAEFSDVVVSEPRHQRRHLARLHFRVELVLEPEHEGANKLRSNPPQRGR